MVPKDLALGIFFLFQNAVGILGNSSLLFHYLSTILTGKSLMPKDLIVKHLTLANSLAIISRGIPQTMMEFGLQYLLDDVACKLVVYLYRVARGTSMQTTCLLSCFQAITISSSNTRWMKLKQRVSKYVGFSCLVTWLLHLLLNTRILMRVTRLRNSRNATNRFNFGYCSGVVSGTIATPLYFLMLSITDVLCLVLMAWASISMMTILLRHKRQVEYLHSVHHSPGESPEARATQTILILVCTFVSVYSASSILVIFISLFDNPRLWVISIVAFVEICFPTFSPFILISSNKFDFRLYFSCYRRR